MWTYDEGESVLRDGGGHATRVASVAEHLARIRALEMMRRRWVGALVASAVMMAAALSGG